MARFGSPEHFDSLRADKNDARRLARVSKANRDQSRSEGNLTEAKRHEGLMFDFMRFAAEYTNGLVKARSIAEKEKQLKGH